eukprot:7379738-Prymnesium_polylepis.2
MHFGIEGGSSVVVWVDQQLSARATVGISAQRFCWHTPLQSTRLRVRCLVQIHVAASLSVALPQDPAAGEEGTSCQTYAKACGRVARAWQNFGRNQCSQLVDELLGGLHGLQQHTRCCGKSPYPPSFRLLHGPPQPNCIYAWRSQLKRRQRSSLHLVGRPVATFLAVAALRGDALRAAVRADRGLVHAPRARL